jgi:hypothetical protein
MDFKRLYYGRFCGKIEIKTGFEAILVKIEKKLFPE